MRRMFFLGLMMTALVITVALAVAGYSNYKDNQTEEKVVEKEEKATETAIEENSDPNDQVALLESPLGQLQQTEEPLLLEDNASCLCSQPIVVEETAETVEMALDECDEDEEDEPEVEDYALIDPISQRERDEVRAEEERNEPIGGWGLERWSLKLRTAAFFPFSSRFRQAYRPVGPDIQVEGSIKLPRDIFEAWANVDSFFQRGSNYGPHGCKRVGNIVNLSFGLKVSYRLCGPWEIYAGLGPSFGWMDIWVDPNRSCKHNVFRRWAYGVVAKSGVYYYISTTVFLEAFADYLFQPVHHQNLNIDVGGLKVGIGLGVSL